MMSSRDEDTMSSNTVYRVLKSCSAAVDALSVSVAKRDRESSDWRRPWVRRRATVTSVDALTSRSF